MSKYVIWRNHKPSLLKLQSVLAEWDYARQSPVLLQKMNHLQALRWRAAEEFAGLVESYRQALESYVQKRSRAGAVPSSNHQPAPSLRLIVNETIKRFNELDAQREWHRRQMTAQAAPAARIAP